MYRVKEQRLFQLRLNRSAHKVYSTIKMYKIQYKFMTNLINPTSVGFITGYVRMNCLIFGCIPVLILSVSTNFSLCLLSKL